MASADQYTRLRGVYLHEPEAMLSHAIALTLEVSCGMAASPTGKRAMFAIARDAQLSQRASTLILRHMLRGMVANDVPSKRDFQRLVREVVALADEQ